ncbi:MAG: hypothetical protein E7425_06110 [Ruminococcaceae bacterium]|jgi:DUF4097 and DUF4098 domain-containing protein YvlB|nr:hypothetical protein [Oscillospiraceae bacterium]
MKKEEFIAALAAEIRDLSKEDIARSLEFYGEAVDERVEGGMSVEEAVADLGGVEGVARQIMSELPHESKAAPRQSMGDWMNALDKGMDALSKGVDALGNRIGREMDALGEEIAAKSIRDEDDDENFGEYHVTEPFHSVDVSVISADVRILRSGDDETHIETEHGENVVEEVTVQNGVLTLTHSAAGSVTKKKTFFGINFNFSFSGGNVTMYLADKLWESVCVKTNSGDVEAEDLRARAVELASKSGDIDVRHLTVEGCLKAESMSGDIEAENVAAGEVQLSSMSGDVETDTVEAGNITMSSKSGDMDLDNTVAHGELTVESTSGDVTLHRCDGQDVFLQSTSGDVEGTLLSPKDFSAHSVSGDVDLPQSEDGAGRCDAHTTSGDVSLRIAP